MYSFDYCLTTLLMLVFIRLFSDVRYLHTDVGISQQQETERTNHHHHDLAQDLLRTQLHDIDDES